MTIQNINFSDYKNSYFISPPIDCWLEQLIVRNDEKDDAAFDKLLRSYKGGLDTLLVSALNVKNYRAVHLLIKHGASLHQSLSTNLDLELKEKFKTEFFKNKYYHNSITTKIL